MTAGRRSPRRRLPPFLGWLVGHLAIGVIAGWSALAAVLWMNVGGLRDLIARSPDGWIALAMLAAFFAITFGSAGMGFAIMSEPRDPDGLGD